MKKCPIPRFSLKIISNQNFRLIFYPISFKRSGTILGVRWEKHILQGPKKYVFDFFDFLSIFYDGFGFDLDFGWNIDEMLVFTVSKSELS